VATSLRGVLRSLPNIGDKQGPVCLFIGAAAVWLESYLPKSPHATWAEFSLAVQTHFCRNQHQILVRRMFHICQTTTVEYYVRRFVELLDQITAFEAPPDPIRYLTRFLDGLKPAVCVLVAIQQPKDLDAPYTLTLLYEELGDGSTPLNHQASVPGQIGRRSHTGSIPPSPPPARWVSKLVEEKKSFESNGLHSELTSNRRVCVSLMARSGEENTNARTPSSYMSCKR
jgi:hypothetical protein